MTFELNAQAQADQLERARLNPLQPGDAGAGVFDGFLRGTGMAAMRGFAEAGRAASVVVGGAIAGVERAGAHHPLSQGLDTTLSDRYFRFHDEVFGRAVEHWTPQPNEVGVASEITGKLLSMLPMVIASPALTVAATQLSVGEDLVRKGVDPLKAQAVGAVQGAGLGLGIWAPIFGRTLAQRVLLGGVGFNVVQGAGLRGVSGAILEGTPAAEMFKAFDPEQLTLDILLGAAFGGITHLSPAQRAQGAKAWEAIERFAQTWAPSDVAALATLRQAHHMQVDTIPGRPVDAVAVDAHVARMRQAIDQLSTDRPVQVDDLPAPRLEADGRMVEAERRAQGLVREAERVARAEGIPVVREPEPVRGPESAPAALDEGMGRAAPENAPERIQASQRGTSEAPADPITIEAARIAAERPDDLLTVGRDADGEPIRQRVGDYVEQARLEVERARADAKLFEIAAACMLGGGAA